MSDIRPFPGLRPRIDLAAKVASPPYDVLNSEEAREMAAKNPLSFLHVVKARRSELTFIEFELLVSLIEQLCDLITGHALLHYLRHQFNCRVVYHPIVTSDS